MVGFLTFVYNFARPDMQFLFLRLIAARNK